MAVYHMIRVLLVAKTAHSLAIDFLGQSYKSDSLVAGHSLESINIESAWLFWVHSVRGWVLIALLEVGQILLAVSFSKSIGWSSKVVWEECTEGWERGSWCFVSNSLDWVWWGEKEWSNDLESLHVWMLEVPNASVISSLEWMSWHVGWMGVI